RPQPEPAPEQSGDEENAEEPKKKRYPHQKAPKNLSTDQFLEKLKENGGATPVPGKDHRRRRGRGGRNGEGPREDAPQEQAQRPEGGAQSEAPAQKGEAPAPQAD
ncbi:MAG: hypothetical protein IJ769_10100, partial [Clostridia bacterium]|nr:hypothetical protein [Clostridia bacterium]